MFCIFCFPKTYFLDTTKNMFLLCDIAQSFRARLRQLVTAVPYATNAIFHFNAIRSFRCMQRSSGPKQMELISPTVPLHLSYVRFHYLCWFCILLFFFCYLFLSARLDDMCPSCNICFPRHLYLKTLVATLDAFMRNTNSLALVVQVNS